MKEKRAFHKEKILAHKQKLEMLQQEEPTLHAKIKKSNLVESQKEDIEDAFKEVVLPKKRKIEDLYKKKFKKIKDDEHYIPYVPVDRHTEEG